MGDNIFLLQDKDRLVKMTEIEYDSEKLLQELLAKYSDLLAGDQIGTSSPRRWLFVSREVEVPSEDEGGGRWSIDHLFLDQDGIPTLVEVKRSSDTRLRREIVGQMLDYAANAVVYWPPTEIRKQFELRCENENESPDQVLAECFGDDLAQGEYWERVATNLRAGKIRMIFVADVIPNELRRIVEFLNEQMNDAEVLALEIRQFAGEGLKTLVPRVYGQTSQSMRTKSAGNRERTKWDERTFFQEFQSRGESESISISKQILEWAQTRGLTIWWGEGSKDGSFYPILDLDEVAHYMVGVRTGYKKGYIQLTLREMSHREPFSAESKRKELVDRLNRIAGIRIAARDSAKYPSFPLTVLADRTAMKQFLETLDWIVREIRKS